MNSSLIQPQPTATDVLERDLQILFDELVGTGERDSIINIEKACKSLSESGIRKITAAAVGKFCTVHFAGPRAQSISNKKKTLAAYVKKWDQLHQMRRGYRPSNKHSNRIAIEDPSVAAYVRTVEAERDEANRTRDRLLQAFRRLEPLRFSDTSNQPTPNEVAISEIERDSIRAFLTVRNLAEFGLSYDARGRISDGRRTFLESPLVQLLVRLAKPQPKQVL